MLRLIFESLVLFLPAYCANAAPVLLARFKLFEFLNIPIDGGLMLGKNRLFGETKTWRGIIGGAMVGGILCWIQAYTIDIMDGLSFEAYAHFIFAGLMMGLGVGLMDLLKSFVKRRLNIASTKPWIPFDQLDYLGGLLMMFFLSRLDNFYFVEPETFWCILIISPIMPVLANLVSYKLNWKKVWW